MLHSILSLIRYLVIKILGEGSVLRTRPMTSIKPLICMTEIRPKSITTPLGGIFSLLQDYPQTSSLFAATCLFSWMERETIILWSSFLSTGQCRDRQLLKICRSTSLLHEECF